MPVSPDDVRAKLDAGRHTTAAWLRRLADDLDALSLEDTAEVGRLRLLRSSARSRPGYRAS